MELAEVLHHVRQLGLSPHPECVPHQAGIFHLDSLFSILGEAGDNSCCRHCLSKLLAGRMNIPIPRKIQPGDGV